MSERSEELNTVFGSPFRSLGNAFQQEAILEIRQVFDEHTKRKRPVRNRFFFHFSGVSVYLFELPAIMCL